jgi:hypothetical protein
VCGTLAALPGTQSQAPLTVQGQAALFDWLHTDQRLLHLKSLHESVMSRQEDMLGGGAGTVGVYGSINAAGVHRILCCLFSIAAGAPHVLLDAGAGLAR